MTDKQPAPVGDCHIVGKAVVPGFNELEGAAKRLQELMVSASMECAGKQQEALAEAMEAYLKVSTPSVMLSLLQQNAELKAERDALAAENAAIKHAMSVTLEHVSVMDTGQAGVAAMIINDAMNNSKTPATDDAIAEWKAQGVEIAHDKLMKYALPTMRPAYTKEAELIAATLRKGGE